jgi:excinuclease ABC subunit B
MVLDAGVFRVRGDVVDIFPIYDDFPVRVEFFGDEIEKISTFNLITGEIIKEINQMTFYPCKNFVTSRETLNKGIEKIKVELAPRLKELRDNGLLLEAQRLEQRTLYDIEMMMELGYCSGIENYSRHLDGRKKGERPYCLLDFFPDNYLMIIDESHVSIPQVRAMYNGDRSRKLNLVEHGFRLPSALDNRPMKFDEFEQKINQVVYVSATPSEYEVLLSDNKIIRQIIRPTGLLDPIIELHKTRGQIDNLIENIKKVVKNNERVLITTLTKKSSEDLTDYLKSMGIKCEYMHSDIESIERVKILRSLRLKHFDVLIGINLLREGLDLPEVSLVAVIDADKEGFLRSKSSLMQVAGRAARNVNGKVILYADRVTNSMKHLIDETDRRREIQIEYNKNNNITPKTILKNIDEINSSTVVADKDIHKIIESDEEIKLNDFDSIELKDKIKEIERKMLNYAKELQFEKAALLRDQLEKLKNNV